MHDVNVCMCKENMQCDEVIKEWPLKMIEDGFSILDVWML